MIKAIASLTAWFAVALGFSMAGFYLLDAYSESASFQQKYPIVVGILSAAVGVFLLIWMLWGLAIGVVAGLLHISGRTTQARSWLRFSPAIIRRIVATTLGISLVAAPGYAVDLGFTPEQPTIQHSKAVEVTAQPQETQLPQKLLVRPGDSLWSIAAAELGPSATETEISQRWQELYQANESTIGSDPHLIYPGVELVTPENSEGSNL